MRREEWPAPLADPQPRMEQEKSEEEEVETNVDSGSINSAVINELFEGVLEQRGGGGRGGRSTEYLLHVPPHAAGRDGGVCDPQS